MRVCVGYRLGVFSSFEVPPTCSPRTDARLRIRPVPCASRRPRRSIASVPNGGVNKLQSVASCRALSQLFHPELKRHRRETRTPLTPTIPSKSFQGLPETAPSARSGDLCFTICGFAAVETCAIQVLSTDVRLRHVLVSSGGTHEIRVHGRAGAHLPARQGFR